MVHLDKKTFNNIINDSEVSVLTGILPENYKHYFYMKRPNNPLLFVEGENTSGLLDVNDNIVEFQGNGTDPLVLTVGEHYYRITEDSRFWLFESAIPDKVVQATKYVLAEGQSIYLAKGQYFVGCSGEIRGLPNLKAVKKTSEKPLRLDAMKDSVFFIFRLVPMG
jgi:hypothetical protein